MALFGAGAAGTPVHIVAEDDHNPVRESERFELLDHGHRRTTRVQQCRDDGVDPIVDVLQQHFEVTVHLTQVAKEQPAPCSFRPASPIRRLDLNHETLALRLPRHEQQDVGPFPAAIGPQDGALDRPTT